MEVPSVLHTLAMELCIGLHFQVSQESVLGVFG